MIAGTKPNSSHVTPWLTPITIAMIAKIRPSVPMLTMWDATSRPSGMFTTDSSSATGASGPSISAGDLAPHRLAEHRGPADGPDRGRSRGHRETTPGCEAQDVGPHRLGVRGGEVLELDVRIGSGADDLQLRHAQQSRDHRPGEVDTLHAVERCATLRAEQDAAAHLDVVIGDAEGVEAPRRVEHRDEHDERREDGEPRQHVEVVRDDEVDGVAARRPPTRRPPPRCRARATAGR